MKFTLSWLKQHLETDAPVETIAETLTRLGLEVEEVVDRSKALAPFSVAYVVEAKQHPNADRLRVCQVDTGAGIVQVVCGAPNARTGMKGVFAPPGTHIPGTGIDLKRSLIRGEESNGMLVSERELGLSDEHDGIIELPDDAALGAPFAVVVGLDDPVIEIGLTPDRADCAGVRGVARDLAAAGLGTLKAYDPPVARGGFASPIGVEIADDVRTACPLFVGRYVRGVKNGPSPRWLRDRLEAIGLRPISALVDMTNFVTMDVGRPLHVFDADKLHGTVTPRLGCGGQSFRALNGKDYTLDDDMTAICDASGVLGLGGIIGGERTGCTDATVNVFIECALFDAVRTAMTGRKLEIVSDARYRFERGVDPQAVFAGIERATQLILELCGGEPSDLVVAGAVPPWHRRLPLRPSRAASLGGVDVPSADQRRILEALGFGVTETADGTLQAEVPSWRKDVEGEADLVEEVLRVYGFDHIPATPMPRVGTVSRPGISPVQRRVVMARRILAARGLGEAVTWSFISGPLAERFGGGQPGLRLVNPISTELGVMRPSILPNLVQAVARNADRGFPDVALFEVGPAYHTPEPDGQALVAAGVRSGNQVPRHWSVPTRVPDVFDVKADAMAVLMALGAPTANLQTTADAPDWYHPGRSGVLRLGPTVLAQFGEMHPAAVSLLDGKAGVVAFEVFLDAVPPAKKKAGTARPMLDLSAFQPVRRDFAFVVDRAVDAERLVRAAKGADKALVAEVGVFDLYEGAGVGDGKKSLALAVTLQPTKKTLTDQDIEGVVHRIVSAVAKATGGVLRG